MPTLPREMPSLAEFLQSWCRARSTLFSGVYGMDDMVFHGRASSAVGPGYLGRERSLSRAHGAFCSCLPVHDVTNCAVMVLRCDGRVLPARARSGCAASKEGDQGLACTLPGCMPVICPICVSSRVDAGNLTSLAGLSAYRGDAVTNTRVLLWLHYWEKDGTALRLRRKHLSSLDPDLLNGYAPICLLLLSCIRAFRYCCHVS